MNENIKSLKTFATDEINKENAVCAADRKELREKVEKITDKVTYSAGIAAGAGMVVGFVSKFLATKLGLVH